MSRIYQVVDLSQIYNNLPAFGILDVYEGVIVSVWDDIDFAEQVCQDLELEDYYD